MKRRLTAAFAIVLVSLSLAAACSGDDSDDDGGLPGDGPPAETQDTDDGETVAPQLQDQPAPAQEIVAEVTAPVQGIADIVIGDGAFQNNNVEIPLGEPVVIRVTNSDTVTHNLRIAGLDGQFETEDDAVTDPQAIPASESGELTFAPPVAGSYTFRCDFHEAFMGGQIVVR